MEKKRATFPLGSISTSCLVPSSQGLSSGLLWFDDSSFGDGFSSQGCQECGCVCGVGAGWEAILSIPHETQWTIQALPTALSL